MRHVDVFAAAERDRGLSCKLILHSSQHPAPDPGVMLTHKASPSVHDEERTEHTLHTCTKMCNQVLDCVRNH
jgi:hypothetical protein